MGQPRPSRRKLVSGSSDEDDEQTASTVESLKNGRGNQFELAENDASRLTGKLKSVGSRKNSSAPAQTRSKEGKSVRSSPKNAKTGHRKSVPASDDTTIPKVKPIYSFFNAATQRQRHSQPSASPEKPPTPHEDREIIDSDDENRSDLILSKGSSTGLALRKRKAQQGLGFAENADFPSAATQKFRKTSDGGRTPSMGVSNDDKRPWTEQFAPLDLTELAVHKRKITDMRQWLETALRGRRHRVLVVKGAAGTGKTTTVRLLAKELHMDVMEWRNPAGTDYSTEATASASAQFEEFLARVGGAGGLTVVSGDTTATASNATIDVQHQNDDEDNMKLLLVEEFPNTFSRTSPVLQSFRSSILQYLASPILQGSPTPLIMIISETLLSTNTAAADSFTAHRLLGPEILNNPYVDTIEFNPVATTILTKALDTIVIKEARKSGRRKTPGPAVIKHLAETGDIRSAISSLEFLCLRGDDGDTWSAKVTFTKTKKSKPDQALTKGEEEALKLISNRESTLGIFHAVGKVVYNKRRDRLPNEVIPQPAQWLPQHRRSKIVETDIDKLMDELGTDTTTFLAALHENYVLSCSSSSSEETLDSLSACIEDISDADLLSLDRFSFGTRSFSGSATDSLRQDEMSFQVSVRGLLFNLPSPVHRSVPPSGRQADAHRMFYPASLKLWKEREAIEGLLDLLTTKMQRGGLKALQSSMADSTSSSVGGVAGWKKNTASEQPNDADGSPATASTSAKMEMLVDRLPFMAHILSASSIGSSSSLLGQIRKVTHMGETRTDPNDGEYNDDPDEQEDTLAAGQWSTDRPETDASNGAPAKARVKRGERAETEGGGLAIPVEHSVAKLVLEDDDIIDE